MDAKKAISLLEKIAADFADEKHPAAHLIRLKIDSALGHAVANWTDPKPDATVAVIEPK